MSLINYNGVNLSYTFTEGIEHTPARDPSGVDMIGMDVTLRLRSVLSPGTYPAVAGEGPGDTMTRIRHMLTAPRRPLVYFPSGTLGVGNGIQVPGGRDDAHGPWPKVFNVQQVTEGSYVVTFAVTVRLTDCSDWLSRGYLSLKWNESTTYDALQRCTKRRSGYLILSSQGPGSADDFRGLITPYCPAGFRRDNADYGVSEDGLTCKFTFVDKQLVQVPPWPALKIRGRMAEMWPKAGIRKGYLSIQADGPPGVNPADLLNVCVRIGMSVVFASNPIITDDANRRVLITGGINKSLDDEENSVGLQLEWAMQPVRQRAAGTAMPPQSPPPPPAQLTGAAGDAVAAVLGGVAGGAAVLAGGSLPFGPGGQIQNDRGRNPAAVPAFGSWVGVGYGTDPAGAVVTPLRGHAQAQAVKMFAAALNDPCGQQLVSRDLGSDAPGGPALQGDGIGLPEGLSVSTLPAPVAAAFSQGDTPSDFAALYSADDTAGVYDHYAVTARYRRVSGRHVVPGTGVGSQPDVGKVVSSHGAMMSCEIAFTARRVGSPPEIPSGEVSDTNMVFEDGMVELDDVQLAADGVTEIHAVTGLFKYGIVDPALVVYAAPVAPFLDLGGVRPMAVESASRTRESIGFPAIGQPATGAGGDFGPFGEETAGGTGGGESLSGSPP